MARGDLTTETGNKGHWEGQGWWEGVVPLSSLGGENNWGSPRGVGVGSAGVLARSSREGPGNTSALSHHHLPSQLLRGWMAPSCTAPHPQIPLLPLQGSLIAERKVQLLQMNPLPSRDSCCEEQEQQRGMELPPWPGIEQQDGRTDRQTGSQPSFASAG